MDKLGEPTVGKTDIFPGQGDFGASAPTNDMRPAAGADDGGNSPETVLSPQQKTTIKKRAAAVKAATLLVIEGEKTGDFSGPASKL